MLPPPQTQQQSGLRTLGKAYSSDPAQLQAERAQDFNAGLDQAGQEKYSQLLAATGATKASQPPTDIQVIPESEFANYGLTVPSISDVNGKSEMVTNASSDCQWQALSFVFPFPAPYPWRYAILGSISWSNYDITYIDAYSFHFADFWNIGNWYQANGNASIAIPVVAYQSPQAHWWVVIGDHLFYDRYPRCPNMQWWNPRTGFAYWY